MASGKTTQRGRKSTSSEKIDQRETPEEPIDAVNEIVEELIKRFCVTLRSQEDVNLTVGDFVRLFQLHKELAQQSPREVEVRWVEMEDCTKSKET